MKILLVVENYYESRLLESMLSEHEVLTANSGELAIEKVYEYPDLIILDAVLPGIDGYQTCELFREQPNTKNTPIIFISDYLGLDDRIKAFDAGGNDYISKPFDIKELNSKVQFVCNFYETLSQSRKNNDETSSLLREIQSQSANIQSITRFIQASIFCHDIETLLKLFKKTANEIGANCIIRIKSDSFGTITESNIGIVSDLENEILDSSSNVERIYTFGNGRAIFNWQNVQLLTRRIDNLIDVLAIFLDSIEIALKSIDTESRLINQVENIEKESTKASTTLSTSFQNMETQLITQILAMGVVKELEIEEEDQLTKMIMSFRNTIENELLIINSNNKTIKALLDELKTPPEDLIHLVDIEDGVDDADDIVLF